MPCFGPAQQMLEPSREGERGVGRAGIYWAKMPIPTPRGALLAWANAHSGCLSVFNVTAGWRELVEILEFCRHEGKLLSPESRSWGRL